MMFKMQSRLFWNWKVHSLGDLMSAWKSATETLPIARKGVNFLLFLVGGVVEEVAILKLAEEDNQP